MFNVDVKQQCNNYAVMGLLHTRSYYLIPNPQCFFRIVAESGRNGGDGKKVGVCVWGGGGGRVGAENEA